MTEREFDLITLIINDQICFSLIFKGCKGEFTLEYLIYLEY